MNMLVFIALIAFGASLLASGLIILSAMMSSRASKRLAEKYPELHGDDRWHESANDTRQPPQSKQTNITQMVTR